jgi:signal transduction histidine kinase
LSPRRTTPTLESRTCTTTVGVERSWLAMLQRVAGRAAHELKNPLNGAMLNVEVVRQRAQRPGTDPALLGPFAEAAATQLARAAELADALLALARPARTPVDLAMVLEPLVMLYDAIVTPTGGRVTLDPVTVNARETMADPALVRCILATAIDQIGGQVRLRCRLAERDRAAAVELHGAARDLTLPEPVQAAMTDAGIEYSAMPDGIVIRFPRHTRDRRNELE